MRIIRKICSQIRSIYPKIMVAASLVFAVAACSPDIPYSYSADYATAMDRLRPLAKIEGAQVPTEINRDLQIYDFTPAIEHVDAMESYAFFVWQNGAIIAEHYREPGHPDLRSESASMHKSFLGLLVATALADGTFPSVETPIGTYIAEWSGDPRGDIPLDAFLTMSTGLDPLSPISDEDDGISDAFRFVLGGDDAETLMLNQQISTAPFTRFHYQNTATQILVRALEAATGERYEDLASKRIWQVIGADTAHVWRTSKRGRPRGYTALLARAEDWLRLGILIAQEGRWEDKQVIPPDILAEFLSPSPANPNYARQIWRANPYAPKRYYNSQEAGPSFSAAQPYLYDDLVFFDGFGGQRVYISPGQDLVIVRLGTNRFDWDDSALPNLVYEILNSESGARNE